jgi:hypothetical protein
MPTISSTSPATALDGALEAAWNSAQTQNTQSNQLPEELAIEAKNNYGDINVRPFFAKLAMDQEKLRDGKIGMKNEELRTLRNKLSTITDFLDKANYELINTNGNTIQMNGDGNANLMFEIKKILPPNSNALKLIEEANGSKFERRKLEWLCQMFTRQIDSEITPQIDELKDDIFDIMQLLDKILPILKELGKKYDDHIAYIQRQPK